MADVIQAGQAILAEVLATLPEESRGKAQEYFASAEAAAAIKLLGESALRQADYSRNSAAAQEAQRKATALYDSNTEWFQSKQAELQELDTLRAKLAELDGADPVRKPAAGDPPTPHKPGSNPDLISRTELQSILADTERGAVGFIAESNLLALQHYKEFGEILNITDLLTDKRVQQIGLSGVYRDRFKEQLSAKASAAAAARDDKIRQEEREKVQREMASSTSPYPIRGNEPSTLDALEAIQAGKAPVVKSVSDLAAEYARLSAQRTLGG